MHSYLFVFSFGQSKGKADKFRCIINVLDVLRESLILVSGGFVLVCFGGSLIRLFKIFSVELPGV